MRFFMQEGHKHDLNWKHWWLPTCFMFGVLIGGEVCKWLT